PYRAPEMKKPAGAGCLWSMKGLDEGVPSTDVHAKHFGVRVGSELASDLYVELAFKLTVPWQVFRRNQKSHRRGRIGNNDLLADSDPISNAELIPDRGWRLFAAIHIVPVNTDLDGIARRDNIQPATHAHTL